MPYELQRAVALPEAVRQVFEDQFSGAIEALASDDAATFDERVHEARKSIKKLRALLRLMRPQLKPAVFQRENEQLRDAAREISASRDAAAVLLALDALAEVQGMERGRHAWARELLQNELRPSAPRRGVQEARRALEAALLRVREIELGEDSFRTLAAGFSRSYERGQQAMRAARDAGESEAFHEWRKHAKDHFYHLRLLEPLWPEVIGGHAESLSRLSELLGDEHDLCVLRQKLLEAQVAPEQQPDRAALIELIDDRAIQLRVAALALGRLVHAESPKALVRRMGRYFKASREEATTVGSGVADAEAVSQLVDR